MNSLALLFITTTAQLGLPTGLLESLCYIESTHDIHAVNHTDGGSASYGVCQVKLDTARLVGFEGTPKQLQEPKANIYYAGLYLKRNIERYGWDMEKAVAAYNAGKCRYNGKGQIKNRKYVNKVFDTWEMRTLYARTGN